MMNTASLKGVSANPIKANHILGKDKVVRIAVKNDYIAGPNLIPQRKVNGKWETIKTITPNSFNPGEKLFVEFSIKESLSNKKGNYRFKMDAERYDKQGNHVEKVGTFYTSEFHIK
ncbi:structural protein [Bacillus altitudinis]|uniref:structural protein n=2 Tax=Bacillus altitudinis TaxID=293387 RepID=UPI0030801627